MEIEVRPGRYVVAVSGGVDSVVLLDLLSRQKDLGLVVAHFDHGIRGHSAKDRQFVQKLAESHSLRFFYEQGNLGSAASEALARDKRYEFLNKIKQQTNSENIATAHHQDDVIETMVINTLRGTGRKGLSSLTDRPGITRPLLGFSKREIINYAKQNNFAWQEDETNNNQKYLRNFVRHTLLKNLSEGQKHKLIKIAQSTHNLNEEIDSLLNNLFLPNDGISRELFTSLSHDVACEVIANWLRREDVRLDKKTIDRLVISLKTLKQGKIIEVNKNRYFTLDGDIIRMNTPGAV